MTKYACANTGTRIYTFLCKYREIDPIAIANMDREEMLRRR